MKVTVKIDQQVFEVEVLDVSTRPVVAIVDGQRFEVWPEEAQAGTTPAVTAVSAAAAPKPPAAPAAALRNGKTKAVLAPIPGVIVAVSVRPGETVTHGQELCVLEAMKMKNVIRAVRDGEIAAVQVSVGQHVKHHDTLMEFTD